MIDEGINTGRTYTREQQKIEASEFSIHTHKKKKMTTTTATSNKTETVAFYLSFFLHISLSRAHLREKAGGELKLNRKALI